MSIRLPDARELKMVVNLAVMNMPGRSELGGYYAPLSYNKDVNNTKSLQFNKSNNYPMIDINGTKYNKVSPRLSYINSLQNAHINPVNTTPSASSCTFAYGGIEPSKVHPIYALLKGPGTRDTFTYNPTFVGSDQPTTYDPGSPGPSTKNSMPVIPFNKFQQYDVEPPILTTYNIWNIYKEEYDSNFGSDKLFLGDCTKYIGPNITNNEPSIRTISDPYNGSSVAINALGVGKSISVQRIYPISMDAIYRQDPVKTNALLYIPGTTNSTYRSSPIHAVESANSGFVIKILSADLNSNDSEIFIKIWDSSPKVNTIYEYGILLRPNLKPVITYIYNANNQIKSNLITQLEGPVFNASDKNSYEIYVHFVGPNVLIGFTPDINLWNSIYPEDVAEKTLAENYITKGSGNVRLTVKNANIKFQYSAIIFNNYNAEDDSLNTDYKSYIFTDFKAQLKPSDKTDALKPVNIFNNFITGRYLGSLAPISKITNGKPSVFGDWRYSSGLGKTIEFSYKEIATVDAKTYRTSYGLLSFDTTIEGPAFLNIENKKTNVKDTGLIYSIPKGDLSPWLDSVSVEVGSTLQNASLIQKTASVTLKNLDTTEHGWNILQLIEHNLCIVQIWAGYETVYPYFQGFITTIDSVRSGSSGNITVSCQDVGSYCLENVYFDTAHLFGGLAISTAITQVIDHSGFSDYFKADYSGVDGSGLRLNANPAAYQDSMKALPTDKIAERLHPLLEKMNTLGQQPVFRWDESNGIFKLEARYKTVDSDLKFLGIGNFGVDTLNPTGQKINVNPDTSTKTPDWHGLLSGEFTINTSVENLAYGVKTYGKTLTGFEAQVSDETFLAQAMSDTAFDNILNSLDSGKIPEGYVGFRKYVIDAYNANEIPSAELLRKKHAINEKIIRNPYHTIQFDCYVTKPLSAHGCFTVSAFLNGDAEVTDKYIYQSLRYTFDKKNNIISAFVRGISQPWTIKELEMKN